MGNIISNMMSAVCSVSTLDSKMLIKHRENKGSTLLLINSPCMWDIGKVEGGTIYIGEKIKANALLKAILSFPLFK